MQEHTGHPAIARAARSLGSQPDLAHCQPTAGKSNLRVLGRGLLTHRSVLPKADGEAQNLPESMHLETPGMGLLTPRSSQADC